MSCVLRGWNRVMPTGMQRITLRQPDGRKQKSTNEAMHMKCFLRVMAAGWIKPASAAQHGRDGGADVTIEPEQRQRDKPGQGPVDKVEETGKL